MSDGLTGLYYEASPKQLMKKKYKRFFVALIPQLRKYRQL